MAGTAALNMKGNSGKSKNWQIKYAALWLSLACIIMFIIQYFFGTSQFVLDTRLEWQQPWRIITSIFAHAGIAHLLFNIFSLAFFGLMLEGRVGPKRTLFIFFFSGIIVNLLTPFTPYTETLGASAAIFGIIGAFTILRPYLVIYLNFVPLPMILASAVFVVQDVLGVFYPNNVAHLSHLIGLAVGIIVGIYWRSRGLGDSLNPRKAIKNERIHMHKADDYFIEKELDQYEKENHLR